MRRTVLLGAAAAVAAAGLVAPTTALAAATPTATITGTVTAPDGSPLAGVTVDASAITQTLDQPSSATVKTNAQGHYRLAALLPWDYSVCFRIGGAPLRVYGPTGLVDHCHGADPRQPLGDSGTPVTVPANTTTVVDEVVPAGAAVAGTLTDDHGQPVVGGKVSAENFEECDSVSGAGGHFIVKGIAGTSTQVCGFPPADSPGPGPRHACAPSFPALTPGAVTTVDVALLAGGGVHGLVVDAAGRPVVHATIGQIVTDHAGRFTSTGQAPGAGALCVTPPVGSLLLTNCPTFSDGVPYRVRAGAFTTVSVTLPAGAAYHGVVTDQANHPLAGVTLREAVDAQPAIVTGPDGAYSLPVRAPGGQVCGTPLPTVSGGTSTNGYLPGCVDVPAGTGDVRVPNLRLARSGALTGRITDTNGRPIAGVGVIASAHGDDNVVYSAAAATDADGVYLVRNLPQAADPWDVEVDVASGDGTVLARDSRAPAGWARDDTVTSYPVTVPRRTIVAPVRLTPAAGIDIHVVDAEGRPVTRAGVHLVFGPGSYYDLYPDADGHTALLNRPAETVQVCATAVAPGPLYPTGLQQVCRKVTTTLGVLTPLVIRQPAA